MPANGVIPAFNELQQGKGELLSVRHRPAPAQAMPTADALVKVRPGGTPSLTMDHRGRSIGQPKGGADELAVQPMSRDSSRDGRKRSVDQDGDVSTNGQTTATPMGWPGCASQSDITLGQRPGQTMGGQQGETPGRDMIGKR